jgi:hypothetical protein
MPGGAQRGGVSDQLFADVQARSTPDLFHAPALWLWETGNMLVDGVAGAASGSSPELSSNGGLGLLAQAARMQFDQAAKSRTGSSQVARLAWPPCTG